MSLQVLPSRGMRCPRFRFPVGSESNARRNGVAVDVSPRILTSVVCPPSPSSADSHRRLRFPTSRDCSSDFPTEETFNLTQSARCFLAQLKDPVDFEGELVGTNLMFPKQENIAYYKNKPFLDPY